MNYWIEKLLDLLAMAAIKQLLQWIITRAIATRGRMLNLAKQNTIQKIGFAVAIFAIIAVLFLHNPVSGYNNTFERGSQMEWDATAGCEADGEGKYLGLLTKRIEEKRDSWTRPEYIEYMRLGKCFKAGPVTIEDKSFDEWESKDPLVLWFQSMIHVMYAVGTIVLAGLVWLVIFASRPIDSASSPIHPSPPS